MKKNSHLYLFTSSDCKLLFREMWNGFFNAMRTMSVKTIYYGYVYLLFGLNKIYFYSLTFYNNNSNQKMIDDKQNPFDKLLKDVQQFASEELLLLDKETLSQPLCIKYDWEFDQLKYISNSMSDSMVFHCDNMDDIIEKKEKNGFYVWICPSTIHEEKPKLLIQTNDQPIYEINLCPKNDTEIHFVEYIYENGNHQLKIPIPSSCFLLYDAHLYSKPMVQWLLKIIGQEDKYTENYSIVVMDQHIQLYELSSKTFLKIDKERFLVQTIE